MEESEVAAVLVQDLYSGAPFLFGAAGAIAISLLLVSLAMTGRLFHMLEETRSLYYRAKSGIGSSGGTASSGGYVPNPAIAAQIATRAKKPGKRQTAIF